MTITIRPTGGRPTGLWSGQTGAGREGRTGAGGTDDPLAPGCRLSSASVLAPPAPVPLRSSLLPPLPSAVGGAVVALAAPLHFSLFLLVGERKAGWETEGEVILPSSLVHFVEGGRGAISVVMWSDFPSHDSQGSNFSPVAIVIRARAPSRVPRSSVDPALPLAAHARRLPPSSLPQ